MSSIIGPNGNTGKNLGRSISVKIGNTGTGYQTYVVSTDGKRFYKVETYNPVRALKLVADIGENPYPITPAPPAPGKDETVMSISKEKAVKLIVRNAVKKREKLGIKKKRDEKYKRGSK